MKILVVGGGLAGLYVAKKLSSLNGGGGGEETPVVLEARPYTGGRIRTVQDEVTGVLYESGPWRVAATHTRVRKLAEELGVTLRPLQTPTPHYGETPNDPIAGLSTWDVHALHTRDPLQADKVDLSTSYADETHSASGSAPYNTDTKTYYVAPQGLDQLPKRMQVGLDVRYDHRVVDVVRNDKQTKYEVTIVARKQANDFVTLTMTCDVLFVCVPPHACREWTIFRNHARSVMHAVEMGELHHIYVQDERFPRHHHSLHPHSLLSQVVSSQYEASSYFQASYTAGRLARFWQHLKLQSPGGFFALLKDELRRTLGFRMTEDADVQSHHWPMAYHRWRTVPDFDLKRAVKFAVEPNPSSLPRVYLAGEAFSSHQAWMEGALETAELALQKFRRSSSTTTNSKDDGSSSSTMVDGHPIAIAKWMRVHPGGRGAISNYKGQDLTDLLAHVGHSPHAWAIAHSLKRD